MQPHTYTEDSVLRSQTLLQPHNEVDTRRTDRQTHRYTCVRAVKASQQPGLMTLFSALNHHAIIICAVPMLVKRAGREDRQRCNQYSTAEHWKNPPPQPYPHGRTCPLDQQRQTCTTPRNLKYWQLGPLPSPILPYFQD